MDLCCLESKVQGAGGVIFWATVTGPTFGPLVPIDHLLMAASSRIMHHIIKLRSSQYGVWNMTMDSLHSIDLHSSIQKSTFGL